MRWFWSDRDYPRQVVVGLVLQHDVVQVDLLRGLFLELVLQTRALAPHPRARQPDRPLLVVDFSSAEPTAVLRRADREALLVLRARREAFVVRVLRVFLVRVPFVALLAVREPARGAPAEPELVVFLEAVTRGF